MTAVVLVPGLSGRPERDFWFLAPMLARTHQVETVSFADPAEPSDPDALLARIGEAVARSGETPILVGYGLGAPAAVSYAALHPLDVTGLVLVAGWLTPSLALEHYAKVWRRLASKAPFALPEVIAGYLYSADGFATVREPETGAHTDGLLEWALHLDVSEHAALVQCPTLVIGCANDQVVSTHQSKLLFGAIPDARYTELRSGHAVVDERPAELLHLITGFTADPARYAPGTIVEEARP